MAADRIEARILLVEDDSTLGYALSEYLRLAGFSVWWARDATEGITMFHSHEDIDLCILDVKMPGMDGFELAEKLKSTDRDIPFIFMTARSLKVDKLRGFRLGADDYITKPVDEEEMIARIRAILKRSAGPLDPEESLRFGHLIFYPDRLMVETQGNSHSVTDKEGQLLELLIRRAGRLLPREEAMERIWGQTDYFTRKTMDVHVYRLRKLLDQDDSMEIANVRNRGFILQKKKV